MKQPMTRSLALLLLSLLGSVSAFSQSRVDLTTIAFGGGGDVNPVTPPTATPPGSIAPSVPTMAPPSSTRIVVVKVVSAQRRVLVLRDGTGRLLDVAWTDGRGLAVLVAVPESGAVLDVLGTDVLGLPVQSGSVLRIVE